MAQVETTIVPLQGKVFTVPLPVSTDLAQGKAHAARKVGPSSLSSSTCETFIARPNSRPDAAKRNLGS